MVDEVIGIVVFIGYGLLVSLAVLLALVVFRTGGDGTEEPRQGGDGIRARYRSWWRRWR